MRSKKALLKNANLYVILDAQVASYKKLFEIAKQTVAAGVKIVQLRDKKGLAKDTLVFAKKLTKLTRQKALFIVNDRVDIALLAKADGVHLGQDDFSVVEARKLVGKNFIIGVSAQSIKHIKHAQKEKVDYIGFGSVFKTLTKPERSPINLTLLKQAVKKSNVPFFAIGGITLKNLKKVKSCGVMRVAICRDICLAKNIRKATKDFNQILC